MDIMLLLLDVEVVLQVGSHEVLDGRERLERRQRLGVERVRRDEPCRVILERNGRLYVQPSALAPL